MSGLKKVIVRPLASNEMVMYQVYPVGIQYEDFLAEKYICLVRAANQVDAIAAARQQGITCKVFVCAVIEESRVQKKIYQADMVIQKH